jgi:hypothetical protein
LVNQNNDRSVFKNTLPCGKSLLSWAIPAFCVNNEFSFRQKFVGNLNGFVQKATTITTQIENQFFHALFFEALQRTANFT